MKHVMLFLAILLFGFCAFFIFTGLDILHNNSFGKETIQRATEAIGFGIVIGCLGIIPLVVWIVELSERKKSGSLS